MAPTQGRISLLAAFHDLADDMGIGDVGARHADHVELALGDCVARRRDIVDARGVKHRELGRGPDFAREIEMRRGRHAGHRDDVATRALMLDVAADDVEEVDHAGILEASGRSRGLVLAETLLPVLVGDQAEADDEIGPDASRIASSTRR